MENDIKKTWWVKFKDYWNEPIFWHKPSPKDGFILRWFQDKFKK